MSRAAVAVALAAVLATSACAAAQPEVRLPPEHAVPDYQLGGAFDPAPGVTLVVRDREASPDPAHYSVCYINAFQTQPGEAADWPRDLLLRDDGEEVADPDWPDEVLLDTSSAQKRSRITERVASWIRGCADAGFAAVEFDNLDSFTRSHDLLTIEDNLALASEIAATAHDAGLAVGQKNAAETTARAKQEAGFDFAVAEECAAFEECDAYSDVYGARVIDIEYTDQLPRPFAELCAENGDPAWMILRDRDLAPAGDPAHTFARCTS
ncbi:endo alpha-1,4 polygalactosaminidase [Leucobacter luti]|uniref:endo alpha-1,4 polygalactosaminidase n=1 Tax=Leucobacter luti TaxID=340320 RepID=UPI003CFC4A9D